MIDLLSSGIISFSSKNFSYPIPSHSLHAPCGLLKLNNLGSISSIVKPDSGQAKRDEYIFISFFTISSIYKIPLLRFNEVSILSANLDLIFFIYFFVKFFYLK